MISRPLLGAALAFLAGAGLGAWLPSRPGALCAIAACAIAAWAGFLAAGRSAHGTAAGLAALLAVGAARSQVDLATLYAGAPGFVAEGEAVVAGRVLSPAVRRGRGQVLALGDARVRRGDTTQALRGPLQLIVEDGEGPYRIGERLVARGRVSAIRGDRNLGWFPAPALPRGRRAAARVIVNSPAWVRRAGREADRGPGAAVLRWREAASARWRAMGGTAAAILDALTTGERAEIPRETEEAFFRSGLTHLLAISGMNVGFLVALVFVLFRSALASWERLALRWPAQPIAAAATAPFLWFFHRFSGSQLPVGRAALMAAAGLAAVMLWRRIDAGEACALAAVLIVAWDPRALFSPSFQLSFAGVAALVLASPRVPRRPEAGEGRRARLVRHARGILVVSLAAGAATAPLVAFHFQQVSLVGPVANLAAVPFTGLLVLPAAWVAMLAAVVPGPWGPIAGAVAERLASGLIGLASFFAAPSWASLRVPRPPLAATLAVLGLVSALLPPEGRRLARVRVAALAAVLVSCTCWALAARGTELRAVFLDVGQGLAVAVFAPGGRTLLVDAGPQWPDDDAGRRIVAPALRALGARRLDVLALTHGHPDHAGGAASILSEFEVREVWVGDGGRGGDRAGPVAAGGPPIRIAGASRLARGEVRELPGGLVAKVVSPARTGAADEVRDRDENDRSLALLLSWRDAALLLTGDAGAGPAREAAAAEPSRPPHLVLQAPHHGGSAEECGALARAFRPELSVISVGRNSYGHPRAEAVAALERSGPVLRTDRDGGVLLRSRGGPWEVRTWRALALSRSWAERLRWLVGGW